MTKKIFRYSLLLSVAALLLCTVLFYCLQYRKTLDDAWTTLRQETGYVALGVETSGASYLESLQTNRHVTWMDAAGNVLFDTGSAEQANQKELAEIRAALEAGIGQAEREADDGEGSSLFYAMRLTDGSVVRLSMSVRAVQTALETIGSVGWVFVLVLMLAALLPLQAARQIAAPINEMDLDHPEQSRIYTELAPLISRLQEQRRTFNEQMEALHRQRKEFTALTDSMSEGFLLLDKSGRVLSANACARGLLPELKREGVELRDEQAVAAAEKALEGEHCETDLQKNGRSWRLIASPVRSRGVIVGSVLLWMDVTERTQRERLRQEFSANVSHELKTPLTSISGFAELMAQGDVPPDKVREFSADIHREAQRMISLIEDILKLSKLDENASLPPREPVELYALSRDVLDSLTATAQRQDVSLTLHGEPCEIIGIWQLLHEMVYNLCDNAIKYNRPGGSVTVTVKRLPAVLQLTVADTGIGIPLADQSRVFERFYRVDKSHSKRVGGTGLGLSIVKHGAQLHNARVTLQSTPNVGTTVTLEFPAAVGT